MAVVGVFALVLISFIPVVAALSSPLIMLSTRDVYMYKNGHSKE